jgi:hypothetical protein
VAIGAPVNGSFGDGHVRVFDWNGIGWIQAGQDIDGLMEEDASGWSVALSDDGNRLAIGAPRVFGASGGKTYVRVFQWNGAAWMQLGTDIDGSLGDKLGIAVSLSSDGGRIAIGAPGGVGGRVLLYEWSGSAWMPMGVAITGQGPIGDLGSAVALSGDGTRVVSGDPSNGPDLQGRVRIHDWNGTDWVPVGADIPGDLEGEALGTAVSISGDGHRVAIGAPGASGPEFRPGHVEVYQWSGAAWLQLGADINGEAPLDGFGFSLSLRNGGNRLAVGAPNATGSATNSGRVYLYDWNGSAWVPLDAIDGDATGDSLGPVALNANGTRVTVGAPGNDGTGVDSGQVRVFTLPGIHVAVPAVSLWGMWVLSAVLLWIGFVGYRRHADRSGAGRT